MNGDAAEEPATVEGIRNVVLVHRAFADGSGWRGVVSDVIVSAAQNALAGAQ